MERRPPQRRHVALCWNNLKDAKWLFKLGTVEGTRIFVGWLIVQGAPKGLLMDTTRRRKKILNTP